MCVRVNVGEREREKQRERMCISIGSISECVCVCWGGGRRGRGKNVCACANEFMLREPSTHLSLFNKFTNPLLLLPTPLLLWRPLTLPPCGPLTANMKRVEGLGLPSTVYVAKAAAWPSMGWLTLRSTEYSCIAPTTRFCCTHNPMVCSLHGR